jgi:outer membrane protein
MKNYVICKPFRRAHFQIKPMVMNKLWFIAGFLPVFFCFEVSAQNSRVWSLQECVDYAYQNNLNIQRSEYNVENNEALLKQSQLARLPDANLSVFNSWRWGRSIDPTTNLFINDRINSNGFSGSAGLVLFNGFQQINAIRQNKKAVESSYYGMLKTRNDVALEVVAAYLNIIFAKELLENARLQLNTSQVQQDQTTKQVEAGALPVTNLYDIQAQVATNEVELINRENDVELTLLQMKQLLQIPASENFDIVTPDIDAEGLKMLAMSSEQVYQQALGIQPEIRSADLGVESAEYGLKTAKGARIPTLSLGGQGFTNYSDQNRDFEVETVTQTRRVGFLESDPTQFVVAEIPFTVTTFRDIPMTTQWKNNRSWQLGFNLAIPIFNGYQVSTGIQRARIQKELADIDARETRNTLRQVIERAYNDARAASKVYDAAGKQVDALEESFRATEKGYNLGASRFVDYQVVSNNLFRARSDLSRAKYDYIFKIKVLDFYVGNPITL